MTNRHNQDKYDAIQAQEEYDSTRQTGTNFLDPEIDVNRSALSKEVAVLFGGKYTMYPLQMPGNLSRVWWLVHNDMQNMVKELEDRIDELEEQISDG